MQNLIIDASILIVVYSFGVVMGFLACLEFVTDRLERKYREREARNTFSSDMPSVVEGTGWRRVSRSRVGASESRGTGHRRVDTGRSGGLPALESGSQSWEEQTEQATDEAPRSLREIRVYRRGGIQSGTIYLPDRPSKKG